VRRQTLIRIAAVILLVTVAEPPTSAQLQLVVNWRDKLDPLLQQRATMVTGRSQVVVRAVDSSSLGLLGSLVRSVGGVVGSGLPIIAGLTADLPNTSLSIVAGSSLVRRISFDRPAVGAMERTGPAVGASAARSRTGYSGAGVGVAIIDSGVTSWHDDLGDGYSDERVDRFVDFVNGQPWPYDDYGHGTHVAGIIAGNGFDSNGARSGIAPEARLIALKTLDGSGAGRISDVIAALDYVVSHKGELNIRVVNVSVAAGVYESFNSDPLTLAAKQAVAAGIVVVAAAGNNGRGPDGRTRYGGVTAPGNAPWVLTVGASSHMGTIDRADDTMAAFSSRGPGAVDLAAKPDVIAPGVGIESLSDPNSAFYASKAPWLLPGTVPTSYLPYLSLSGTSMAAPVVTGTVALMMQANPALTPNQVKAIIEYTAQTYPGFDRLTQGAGFLNADGAIALAEYFANPTTGTSPTPYPSSDSWSTAVVWGTHAFTGGRIMPDANAWSANTVWGAPAAPGGGTITFGLLCLTAACDAPDTSARWSTNAASDNVVWGVTCGGSDCSGPWDANTVFGTSDDETVVWGTSTEDTVVWGTTCSDPSCESVIWP
jgi:serine protease AprX